MSYFRLSSCQRSFSV